MAKLWDFTNSGRTQVRYNKNTGRPTRPPAGACFGYSLIWASKMVNNTSAKLSKPSIVGALPLQQKVEQINPGGIWDPHINAVVKGYGYNSALSKRGHITSVLVHFGQNAGYYIYDIGYHWFALGNNANKEWYYFDSNDGLFLFRSKGEAITFIVKDLQTNYMNEPDFEINNNAIYKITK
ncbi:MAG: hypothetical protein K8R63_09055 [Bacteroidales bacterium]|nr:hypothetical protein [Bacteroidales bacterium]